MKFGVVNKSAILNRLVLHTLKRNTTRLAVITQDKHKTRYFERGETGKEPMDLFHFTSTLEFHF